MFALVVSFFLFKANDESFPRGTKTIFTITDVDSSLRKDQVVALLQRTASDGRVNIYKIMPDPHAIDSARIVYTFIGDRLSYRKDLGGGRYPDFGADFRTRLIPGSQIGTRDLRGTYGTTAAGHDAALIRDELARGGLTVAAEEVDPGYLLGAVVGSPLLPIGTAVILALLLVLGYTTTDNRKRDAIQIAHGYSQLKIMLRELGSISLIFGVVAAGLTVSASIALFAYNGLNQWREFGSWAFLAIATSYVTIITCQLLCFAAQRRSLPLTSLVKGRRPLAFLGVVSATTQGVVLVVIFLSISSTLSAAETVRADQRQNKRWAVAADYATLRFAPGYGDDELNTATGGFGRLVREQESRGAAILAYHPGATNPSAFGYGPDQGNSLIVNPQFLREQRILDPDGAELAELPARSNTIHLLIPENLHDHQSEIVGEYAAWASFQRSLQDPSTDAESAEISVVGIRSHQEIFNYGGTFSMKEMTQIDPVIAVVPAQAHVASDDLYLAAATQGSVLFKDQDALTQSLQREELDRFILSIDTASDHALAELSHQRSQVRAYLFTVMVAVAVLMFSSLALAAVYCDRKKQSHFAEYSHGLSFGRIHADYFLLNLLGGGGVLLLALRFSGRSADTDLLVAACILAVNLAFSAGVVSALARRFRADFVKRQ